MISKNNSFVTPNNRIACSSDFVYSKPALVNRRPCAAWQLNRSDLQGWFSFFAAKHSRLQRLSVQLSDSISYPCIFILFQFWLFLNLFTSVIRCVASTLKELNMFPKFWFVSPFASELARISALPLYCWWGKCNEDKNQHESNLPTEENFLILAVTGENEGVKILPRSSSQTVYWKICTALGAQNLNFEIPANWMWMTLDASVANLGNSLTPNGCYTGFLAFGTYQLNYKSSVRSSDSSELSSIWSHVCWTNHIHQSK